MKIFPANWSLSISDKLFRNEAFTRFDASICMAIFKYFLIIMGKRLIKKCLCTPDVTHAINFDLALWIEQLSVSVFPKPQFIKRHSPYDLHSLNHQTAFCWSFIANNSVVSNVWSICLNGLLICKYKFPEKPYFFIILSTRHRVTKSEQIRGVFFKYICRPLFKNMSLIFT